MANALSFSEREMLNLLGVAFSLSLCRRNSVLQLVSPSKGSFRTADRKAALDAARSLASQFAERFDLMAITTPSVERSLGALQATYTMNVVYAALNSESEWRSLAGAERVAIWNAIGLPFEEAVALAAAYRWSRKRLADKITAREMVKRARNERLGDFDARLKALVHPQMRNDEKQRNLTKARMHDKFIG